jgi:hypothetical protein
MRQTYLSPYCNEPLLICRLHFWLVLHLVIVICPQLPYHTPEIKNVMNVKQLLISLKCQHAVHESIESAYQVSLSSSLPQSRQISIYLMLQ